MRYFIAAILLASIVGCDRFGENDDSVAPVELSIAEQFDGMLFVDTRTYNTALDELPHVDVFISNYTDFDVRSIRCDFEGFYLGENVSTSLSKRVFEGDHRLLPGQTKLTKFILDADYVGVSMDGIAWNCSYESIGSPENERLLFSGRSGSASGTHGV